MATKITAPTMIMWGMKNPTVMHLEADVFQLYMKNAPSLVKKYPDVSHYMYLEIPAKIDADIGAFLTGAMDADLVYLRREPYAATKTEAKAP